MLFKILIYVRNFSSPGYLLPKTQDRTPAVLNHPPIVQRQSIASPMVEPGKPVPTVKFIDEYCQIYQNIFPEVRSFEAFKYLHLGMISDIKRKTLPSIAKVIGLDNHQALHHFLTESPWDVKELSQQRLELIL